MFDCIIRQSTKVGLFRTNLILEKIFSYFWTASLPDWTQDDGNVPTSLEEHLHHHLRQVIW